MRALWIGLVLTVRLTKIIRQQADRFRKLCTADRHGNCPRIKGIPLQSCIMLHTKKASVKKREKKNKQKNKEKSVDPPPRISILRDKLPFSAGFCYCRCCCCCCLVGWWVGWLFFLFFVFVFCFVLFSSVYFSPYILRENSNPIACFSF